MKCKKRRTCSTEEASDLLTNGSEASQCPEESSSEEETDLVFPEDSDCSSDPDYETPSSDSNDDSDDEDYEPRSAAELASVPHQRLQSFRSSTVQKDVKGGSAKPAPAPDAAPSPQKQSESSTSGKTNSKRKAKTSQKSVRTKRSRGEEERWHNSEEKDEKPEPFRFLPSRTPGPTLDTKASWSPLSLFQLFFSSSVVHSLVDNTNANARRRLQAGKKYVWSALTLTDFYIFMTIIIFSGLVNVHQRSDFWRKKWPYSFPFPRDTMTRDRFESILWSLHLSNPEEDEENQKKRNTAEFDPLFKLKPLYTEIAAACQAHLQPYRNISIGERMVASKARHSMKQYLKKKPTKWGYKLFVLADSSTGYTWNFFIYTGKSKSIRSSVTDLLPFSLLGGGYTLYVDHFYTSPALFQDLSARNIGCCGTIRRSRKGFPQTEENDLPKTAERGDLRWLRKDNLLFVKWMDTHEVALCSTVHEAFSGQTVRRRVREAGVWQSQSILVPDAVVDYNQNMGGVDLSDALIGFDSVHPKSMNWYKTFFYHFVDIAVVNSFILYQELCKLKNDPTTTKPLSHKQFREQLAAEMLRFAKGSAPPPPPPTTCMPVYWSGTEQSQRDSRRYCRRCQEAGIPKMKTPVHCRKCQVSLCLTATRNCFQQWHDAQ